MEDKEDMSKEEIDSLVKAAVARNGRIIQQLPPPAVLVNLYEYIQKELNKYPCPEHGTTPKMKLAYSKISLDEYCCETQYKLIDGYMKRVANGEGRKGVM